MFRVLLVVDMQGDFIDGSLPVPDARDLGQQIALVSNDYDLVVATRDWHPGNHMSFKQYGGKWPRHCVKGDPGARLDRNIDQIADVIFSKGTDSTKEAYSGFDGTQLGNFLTSLLPTFQNPDGSTGRLNLDLTICGVATDYCVIATAIDAAKLGFKVTVPRELTRGVDDLDSAMAFIEMEGWGINV
jgi:nicotinamidase/pyrazinamidase